MYTLTEKRLQLIKNIRQLTLRHSIQELQTHSCTQLEFLIRLLLEGIDV